MKTKDKQKCEIIFQNYSITHEIIFQYIFKIFYIYFFTIDCFMLVYYYISEIYFHFGGCYE